MTQQVQSTETIQLKTDTENTSTSTGRRLISSQRRTTSDEYSDEDKSLFSDSDVTDDAQRSDIERSSNEETENNVPIAECDGGRRESVTENRARDLVGPYTAGNGSFNNLGHEGRLKQTKLHWQNSTSSQNMTKHLQNTPKFDPKSTQVRVNEGRNEQNIGIIKQNQTKSGNTEIRSEFKKLTMRCENNNKMIFKIAPQGINNFNEKTNVKGNILTNTPVPNENSPTPHKSPSSVEKGKEHLRWTGFNFRSDVEATSVDQQNTKSVSSGLIPKSGSTPGSHGFQLTCPTMTPLLDCTTLHPKEAVNGAGSGCEARPLQFERNAHVKDGDNVQTLPSLEGVDRKLPSKDPEVCGAWQRKGLVHGKLRDPGVATDQKKTSHSAHPASDAERWHGNPELIIHPVPEPLPAGHYVEIYFDLETTGLGQSVFISPPVCRKASLSASST